MRHYLLVLRTELCEALPVSTKDRAVRHYLLVLRTGLREALPVGTKDRAVRDVTC